MAMTIIDSATAAAVEAATTQYDQVQALIADWAGGNVTVKVMASATLLSTLTFEPWVHNRVPEPDELSLGANLTWTHAAEGTPTKLVFCNGATEIFDCTAGVGSGDAQASGSIKSLSFEDLSALVFTAVAALPAGGPLYPAWRSAIAPNTWGVVTTHKLNDINPGAGATDITPVGADWEAGGATAYLPWTAGCWDESTKTYHLPVGGGHTDYGGNEPYKIDLSSDSPTWVMVRPPSGAVPPGPTLTARDGLEGTGVYADGRIRAQHTYNNAVFIPGVGPSMARQTAHFYSGGSGAYGTQGIRKVWTFDADGEGTVQVDYTANASPGNGEGGTAFDPTRGTSGTVWYQPTATSVLEQIDVAAWTVTNRGSADNWLLGSGSLCYIPNTTVSGGDKLAHYPDNRGGSLLAIRELSTYTAARPTLSGSFSAGFSIPAGDGFGFEWCEDLGLIALWNNATNTSEISTLTPSDPTDLTQPWTRGTLTVDPSNAVTPTAAHSTGTFKRFWYSTGYKGFFLLNDENESLYFFAIE